MSSFLKQNALTQVKVSPRILKNVNIADFHLKGPKGQRIS